MDPARLYVTHHERDEESRKLWLKRDGLARERACSALGDKDNLWAAGDTGPWGYDTEYFWDFAPDGQPLDKARFEALCDSGRIVEIGNDVFMQFNRDEHGVVTELPMKNVDYGGGLERYLDGAAGRAHGVPDGLHGLPDPRLRRGAGRRRASAAQRRGAVHAAARTASTRTGWQRTTSAPRRFLLGDGVTPGNVGRNYVLRRLIRRIIAQAYRLGVRAAVHHAPGRSGDRRDWAVTTSSSSRAATR